MLITRVCLELHQTSDGGLSKVAAVQKLLEAADTAHTGMVDKGNFNSAVLHIGGLNAEDKAILFRHYEEKGTGETNYRAFIAELTEVLEKHEGAKEAIANRELFRFQAQRNAAAELRDK
jgi:hypothetical protein